MTPLAELATRLRKAVPNAQVTFAEPAAPGGVGFLDVHDADYVLTVEWHENSHFGVSSPDGQGYGEKPDEIYRTVDDTASRIIELVRSRGRTEPQLRGSVMRYERPTEPVGDTDWEAVG